MGFYELGNGCDSCDMVQPISNVNMQMDPNSSLVASMVMPYGTQGSAVKQYNGAISSGYVTQGTNMGSMGMGSSGSTLGAQTVVVQTAPATVAPAQVMKQVTVPGPVKVVVPSANGTVEGFANNANNATAGMMTNQKMWIVLGLVIFTALATNECCKYFLNKSLQLNDGSPLYYVAYAGVAALLAFAVHTYAMKN
jgi:hypothetical protein